MSYTYPYPRPMVTVDIILFNPTEQTILLIKRLNNPYANYWALAGGFVDEHEDLETAAIRELYEETNIKTDTLTQFKTYGTPYRDPRGHTISVVFFKIIQTTPTNAKASDDAKELQWHNINNLPELAFDHKQIIEDFLQHQTDPQS